MPLRRRLFAPKVTPNEPPQTKAIGLSYPLSDGGKRMFQQTFTTVEQVISNLYVLFNTNIGERMLQPDLGCSLHSILFEPITSESEFTSRVRSAVTEPIATWLPYLSVVNCDVVIGDPDGKTSDPEHAIIINLSMSISGTNTLIPIRIYIDEIGTLRIIQFNAGDLHG